jgi:hypothetical protein
MVKTLVSAASIFFGLALAFSVSTQAAVVSFGDGSQDPPVLTFADGTFSHDLTIWPDGFYPYINEGSTTTAYIGYGADGEYITFNSGVTLNSLVLTACAPTCAWDADSVTVSLFDFLTHSWVRKLG